MSILSRYISRRLLLYYLGLLGMLIAFFVFVDFMENINRITKYHAPLEIIGLYYGCLTPKLFIEMSWIAFLVAILFVLGSLAKNNEFTAMVAGGISIYRAAAPLVFIGTILSIAVFGIQELFVPSGILQATEIDESAFSHKPDTRVDDIAGVGKHNTLYFSDVADLEHGILKGVHIYTKKDGAIVQRIDAQSAVWDEAAGRWHLQDGVIIKFDSLGLIKENTQFSRMDAPFKEPPKTFKVYSSHKGELSFRELKYQIKNLEKSGYDAQRPRVEYYKKFAFPIMNLVVIFLGLPFALECKRGGLAIGFALSLLAAFLYFGAFQISVGLGKGGLLPAVVAAWLPNFLFLGIGTMLTMKART